MARKTFEGYSLTELRSYAREHKIAGRMKMTGDELLVMVRACWDAQRRDAEALVMRQVTIQPGTLLRHKATGDVIRVTGDIYTWKQYGALCVPAEYVECQGWGDGRRVERAAYQNECDGRREPGNIPVHPLWQYEAAPVA
jgi:hypothetical protein